MERNTIVRGFIIFYVGMTYYLWQNNDSVAQIIANDSLKGVFFYLISNISYVMIVAAIFLLNSQTGFIRNIIASFTFIFGIDILSYPRLLLSTGGLTTNVDILASSDALVMRHLLQAGIPYQMAFNFYYLILPIILLIVTIKLLGFTNFHKMITGKPQ